MKPEFLGVSSAVLVHERWPQKPSPAANENPHSICVTADYLSLFLFLGKLDRRLRRLGMSLTSNEGTKQTAAQDAVLRRG